MLTTKTRWSAWLVALAIVGALAMTVAVGGCGTPKQPVVNNINHITIDTTDAANLFALFTQGLGLPEAWPLTVYPQYSTGGVQAGNVNIETLQATGQAGGDTSQAQGQTTAPMAFIYGTVFEPAGTLTEVTPELKARGADPSKPKEVDAQINGKTVTMWTNVTLQALGTKEYIVYLCEYSPEAKAHLEGRKATPPLGGIGVTSMKEVDIVTTDVEKARKDWEQVFAPSKMSSDGLMPIGDGPAVRIRAGTTNRIAAIVFEVQSIDKAVEYLKSKNLLATSTASQAKVDPTKMQGLDIRLVK